jgi:hypothetical protein
MAKFLVKTPVPGYSGTLGGVQFHDGRTVIDEDLHPAELAYCRGKYVVEPFDGTEPAAAEAQDARGDASAMPRKSASKGDWVAYATAHGMTAEEAEAFSRDQLAELFKPKTEENQP